MQDVDQMLRDRDAMNRAANRLLAFDAAIAAAILALALVACFR